MAARVSEQERIEQINALPNIRFVRWDGEYKNKKVKLFVVVRIVCVNGA